jgi:YD repeat-containing protein
VSGTLHSASNDAATYTYAYDALDRVTDTTSTISGLQSTVNLHEGYNRWGVRTSLKATIGTTSDFENVYTYHHALGYLETVERKAQAGGSTVIDKMVTFHNDILGRWDTIDCQVYDPDSPYADDVDH